MEKTQKQLLLTAGLISSIGGILTAAGGVVGGFTDLFGKIDTLHKLPAWSFFLISGFLLLLGLWFLFKWRMRYSRLLRPDALRLDRNNTDHLVGRAQDIENLRQQCLLKPIVFLEGESGSGKSALVRSGLLPNIKNEKSLLPLMLPDLWVDQWEHGPINALKIAITDSGALLDGANFPNGAPKTRSLAGLPEVELGISKMMEESGRSALIIFDQFDDYQARNRDRFLPNKIWLGPDALRREHPFWDMIARLLESGKARTLFVTRSDTAAGLNSVQFLGVVEALRLDRVPSPYISELLVRLTEGKEDAPIIADPEAGWNKLRERIVRDVSQQDVVLPQQLKIMLGGIQGLRRLNIAHYERAGGASGIEALYIEQQITGASRKVGLETAQVRAILIALIDPANPTKTIFLSKQHLVATLKDVPSNKLDAALQELERGEIVRSITDPETGLIAYRLDHDYLARGVLAAERRANRWYYLLADGAMAFQNAGSIATKWKALLPIAVQARLIWQRLKGAHHYGMRRNYALISLVRLVPLLALVVSLSVGWATISSWREQQAAAETARKILVQLEFRNGVTNRELEAVWTLASTRDLRVRSEFVNQLLATREYAEHFLLQPDLVAQSVVSANPAVKEALADVVAGALKVNRYDQRSIAAVMLALQVDKVEVIGASQLIDTIKETKDTNHLRVLGTALAAVVGRSNPGDVYSELSLIVDAMKAGLTPPQSGAFATTIALGAKQLKSADAYALARPTLEMIKIEKSQYQLQQLSGIVIALLPQLKPEDSNLIANVVLDAVRKRANADFLTEVLPKLGPWLKGEDASALARSFGEIIQNTKGLEFFDPVSNLLVAEVGAVRSEDVSQLAVLVLERIKNGKDDSQQRVLARVFTALAGRLKEENVSSLGSTIKKLVTGTKDVRQRLLLVQSLFGIVPRLKPDDREVFTGPLVEAFKKDPESFASRSTSFFNPDGRQPFIDIGLIGAQLNSQQTNAIARWALDYATQRPLSSGFSYEVFFGALSGIAPRLTAQDAFALESQLVELIKAGPKVDFPSLIRPFQNRDRSDVRAMAIFVSIAPRLNSDDAYAIARQVIGGIKDDLAGPQQFSAIAAQLRPESLRAFAVQILEALKSANTIGRLTAIAPAIAATSSQLTSEEARSCANLLSEALEQLVGDQQAGLAKSVLALTGQLPKLDRLKLLASLLKYPTIYGGTRDLFVKAIKEHPDAHSIQSPGQIWQVITWLKSQQGIDVEAAPQRAKSNAG